MIAPIPQNDIIQSTSAAIAVASTSALQVGTFIQSFFPNFDFRTFVGEPGFLIAENIVNYLCKPPINLQKGMRTILAAWIITIVLNVIAALVLNLDIKSAIITGVFIGAQANLYHDISKT